jgi:hypothetical protein
VKVDILIPSYRPVDTDPIALILQMASYTAKAGHDVGSPLFLKNGIVTWARNNGMAQMREDADFVLWVDDDMLPPADSLVRLLKHDQPVVSALMTTRALPPVLCVKAYDREKDTFCKVERVKPDTLIKGDIAVGTGFLLLRRDAIDAVSRQYAEARDWLDDVTPLFNRLGVNSDKREEERARLAASRADLIKRGQMKPQLFEFFVNDAGQPHGEDISFCRRLLRLGFKIAVDTSVQIGHAGVFPYGPWNLGESDPKEMDLS